MSYIPNACTVLQSSDRDFIAEIVRNMGNQLLGSWLHSVNEWNNTRHDSDGITNAQWSAIKNGEILAPLPADVSHDATVLKAYIFGLDNALTDLNVELAELYELSVDEQHDQINRFQHALEVVTKKTARANSLLTDAKKRLDEIDP